VFIYFHGGGWVIGGNIDEFDTLGRKLAAGTAVPWSSSTTA
jgi:acetyl esterase